MDEDITHIQDIGGLEAIAAGLNTNLVNGLDGKDFSKREKHFGSNSKPPMPRSSKNIPLIFSSVHATVLACDG